MRAIYPALLLVALLAGCNHPENTTAAAEPSTAVSVWKKESQLWANMASGEKQLLAEDGQDYDTTVSADGRWLVVDVALFSNMQITRLLERSKSGSYQLNRNLSQEVWHMVCDRLAIDIDDLVNARTRFVTWSDDGKSVTVEASAHTTDGDDIVETLTIPLSRENS